MQGLPGTVAHMCQQQHPYVSLLWPQDGSITLAALNHFPSLQRLSLNGTQQQPEGGPWALAGKLQQLHLSRWGCIASPPLLCAVHLATGLKQLHFSGGAIWSDDTLGSEDTALLATALQCMPHLKVLDLNNCRIGTAGALALAPALQQLTGLHEL